MKIALIGTTAESLIQFRKELINLLHKNGHVVYAFAIDYDDVTKEKVKSFGAIPVHYCFSRTGLNPFSDVINTYKLYKILKSLKLDLAFSYFSKPAIFGTLAAKFARIQKRYAMLEGLGFFFTNSGGQVSLRTKLLKKILVSLYKVSFRHIESLILLNADDKRDLLVNEKIQVKKVHILGGIGLNMSDYPYCPPPVDPVSFIFVARFLQEKGVYEFIEAAKIVKNKFPETHFCMLGHLDLHNPGSLTIERLNDLKCNNIIELPGHVDNVQEWLAKASVFVLPSWREGFPRSTQEAMAMGRAVITSDVPGCRDTVVDGVNGFLIKPKSAEELADKMIYFLNEPDEIKKMGEASYNIAKMNFDSSIVNINLLSILDIPINTITKF
ncbi:glycosyltransferase family 4 protein [Citrobacter braakii]|jgi:glycosyltransferase involved in cell wall biosynthesis|uniref:glycosyltransferase family 4 protein n=1 Tax=Citrobacter TaxID=544 RepID=UPI0019041B97|nr:MULTISPECIES: glycosyltransferase family 4 protein [Citrobacter]MBJ9225420.1 glycosyltransferase family 4 protein [Citrobacter braakii]MBU5643079.1 glycosyltransferase family 4 protein [Citrobacter sp. S46_ASV_140]MEB2304964.1 glycosyltransferase family 4 protein [Citrobacter braakii]